MARGRPQGRSKSDHRVCQAARHARAADYRERISISAEQQEARIAAVNAACDVEDAPRRRRGQKTRHPETESGAARVSVRRRSSKVSGSARKKANKPLEHALGKAAGREPHTLYCHMCGATAELGLRGGKEGGSIRYTCKMHATSNGCFRVDKDRTDWFEDRELRRLRSELARLEEELRQLGGASFTAPTTSAWEELRSMGDWASVPMSKSLIAALLMMGGIEINPGPTADEIAQLKESWRKADSTIDAPLLDYLAEEALTLARWRGMTDDGRSKLLADLIRDYSGKWYKGWTAILDSAAGTEGLTSSGKGSGSQLQGHPLRVSGNGLWSTAVTTAICRALDPLFDLLDSEGKLPYPCWTAPSNHPQAAYINSLAIPELDGQPSLLLHRLPEKGQKGLSAADRLIELITATRSRYGGRVTQLGRVTFALGVSGCGKTRTGMEALCAGYGCYLNFSTEFEPGTSVLGAAVQRFEQRFRSELNRLLAAGNEEGLRGYRIEKLNDGIKLVVRILLGEVLCLERFLDVFGSAATPKKHLTLQLIGLGQVKDWLLEVWNCLHDVALDELTKHLQRAVKHVLDLTGQKYLLVVVDEAHLALFSLVGHFPDSTNVDGRSFLNAWVRSLANDAFDGFHFVFTGTNLGIAERDALTTAIGKELGVPAIFSEFGINSAAQARSFAFPFVPANDCQEGLWEIVAGRYRFAAELAALRLRGEHSTWKDALCHLKAKHTAGTGSSGRTLIGRLNALKSSSDSYGVIIESLKGLVTDRYIMGVARAQYRRKVDLVELGFCHLVRAEEEDKENEDQEGEAEAGAAGDIDSGKELWRVSLAEPMAAMAARVYFQRQGLWDQSNEVEQLMLAFDLPSPAGTLWDYYMPEAIKDLFSPEKDLAEHPLLSSINQRLPAAFFARPRIVCLTKEGAVSEVTDMEQSRTLRGTKGYGLADFLEDPQGVTFLVPEEEAGPDDVNFVLLRDEKWLCVVQCKLRGEYERTHALKAVTIDLMYAGAAPEVRHAKVARVKAALEQKGVTGIVRIVVAYPSTLQVETCALPSEGLQTRQTGLPVVQIGVSRQNAKHFFRKEHLNVLDILKFAGKKRARAAIDN